MRDGFASLVGRVRGRPVRGRPAGEDMWVAHDRPESPLAYGAWLCSCEACTTRARTDALFDPSLPLMLKHQAGRALVTLDDYVDRGPLSLADELFADTQLIEDGDVLPPSEGLREVFVAHPEARGWWGRVEPAGVGRRP